MIKYIIKKWLAFNRCFNCNRICKEKFCDKCLNNIKSFCDRAGK